MGVLTLGLAEHGGLAAVGVSRGGAFSCRVRGEGPDEREGKRREERRRREQACEWAGSRVSHPSTVARGTRARRFQ